MEIYGPEYLTFYLVAHSTLVSAIVAVLATLVLTLLDGGLTQFLSRFTYIGKYIASASIPVGLVAFASGYLTSVSRASAVGTVLPAVLALFAGLNVYVFGSDSKYKIVVGYCACLFTIMLLYGTQYGAFRLESERVARLMELTRQELTVRAARQNLDLPAEIPTWILPTDLK